MHGRTTTIGQRVPLHARPLYPTTGSPSPFGWLRGAEIQQTMFVHRVFCSNYLPILGLLCRGSPCSSQKPAGPRGSLLPFAIYACVSPSLPSSSTRTSWFSLTLPGLLRLCRSLCPNSSHCCSPPHLSQGSLSHFPRRSTPTLQPLTACMPSLTTALYHPYHTPYLFVCLFDSSLTPSGCKLGKDRN